MSARRDERDRLSEFIDVLNRGAQGTPAGEIERIAAGLKAEEATLRALHPTPPLPPMSVPLSRTGTGRWWSGAAALAAGQLAIGLVIGRPAVRPASIPKGQAALPLRVALPYLRPVWIPVYLPLLHEQEDPRERHGPTSMAGTLDEVRAGPATAISKAVRQPWTRLSGTPQPIALPGGIQGRFYPGQGITWAEGGWHYEVVTVGPVASSADALLPLARRIIRELGPAKNPIGSGTHGYLFQDLAPDNAAITIYFTEGPYGYEVWGYHASALKLAASLVRVPQAALESTR